MEQGKLTGILLAPSRGSVKSVEPNYRNRVARAYKGTLKDQPAEHPTQWEVGEGC